MHPSKDIVGSLGRELEGKRIVHCITSSVACIECPEIARELMRHGAEVFVVMTQAAQRLISPSMMEWATGNPVVTELTGRLEHIALAEKGKSDLILVCPATANTISKIACGIDDTPVTSVVSVALGSGVPILIVPAMHEAMYQHPILKENVERLKALGVEFVQPRLEEGKAKVAEISEIVERVIRRVSSRLDMRGLKTLITAGPTVEYIDPVRIITNKSSGRMGVALAEEALSRGSEVTLVYGRGSVPPPKGAKAMSVETTEEMRQAVLSELRRERYDLLLAAAAPADYSPEEAHERKVESRSVPRLKVELKVTTKIVDSIKEISPKTYLVAFKAEYNVSEDELIKRAYESLTSSKADLIVANDLARPGSGFQAETNEVYVVDRERQVIHLPAALKREVAKKLLDIVLERLRGLA